MLTYTGLFLFALLFIIAGYIWSRMWRNTGESWVDWEGDVFEDAAEEQADIPPVSRPSDLAGCKRDVGDLRCDVRAAIAAYVNGQRWPQAYPSVRAWDNHLTFATDQLILASPEEFDNKQLGDAIRRFSDNMSMVFDATKKLPSLDQLERTAKDAWIEGCAPR